MTTSPKLQAVVLTGSRNSHNPLIEGLGLQSKVMLPLLGQPMVLYVLEALMASEFQPELYVSSNDPDVLTLPVKPVFQPLPSGESAVSSLIQSLESLPGEEWVLFVSGDHPLLTAEMIDYFVRETWRRDLTFSVAAVERAQVKRHYPESRRTYFNAKNGAYSGGNLFLVNKRKFQGSVAFMEMIDRNRKKPWKNIHVLPVMDMILILLRQLNIHAIARKASRLFGCEAGVVEMPFAECCMDVDKHSDREIAEKILRQRAEKARQDEERSRFEPLSASPFERVVS